MSLLKSSGHVLFYIKNMAVFIYKTFLDFVYPPICILCGHYTFEDPAFLCKDCIKSLVKIDIPLKCVSDLSKPPEIPHWFTKTLALYEYNDVCRELIHICKYKKLPIVASFLGVQVGQLWDQFLDGERIDCIVPVPLHPRKQRERGYNQAELLALYVSRACGVPVRNDILKRIKYTRPQAKMHRAERVKNPSGAFGLKKNDLAGMNIVIFDDVMTTGSTLNECARLLKYAGASSVIAVTVSRIE